ncbi:MAG TPA: 3D domain-containing protein [Pyrinomonadaceae bacterium]|nr:3D domain-containing protein [Pyrinomonadaceae bacterium]
MKSLLSGSTACAGAALLLGFLIFSAKPSSAESLLSQDQQSKSQPSPTSTLDPVRTQNPKLEASEASSLSDRPVAVTGKVIEEEADKSGPPAADKAGLPAADKAGLPPADKAGPPAAEPITYVATAYSLRGRTASGMYVTQGIIAADPRVLPLGSRVRVEAGRWSGEYLVADTGGRIKGRRIDIWTPTGREAMRFGRRKVKLTILSYGGKRKAVNKPVQL